jgi:N-acetylglucosamine-6-sulfatase
MQTISRRRFVRSVAGSMGATGLFLTQKTLAARQSSDRPNFVFIFTDDQRWDAMSCMGHPFLRTPNMDRLAREGVRFANAFVVNSLCSPSRACFLTGVYSHTHGVVSNDVNDYDPNLPTYPLLLRQAGYQTAYVGKFHQAPKSDPRPGFDYWLSFRGQGIYNDPELNENGRTFKAEGYMTDLLTDAAVRWLRQPRAAPFCLTLAHKASHGPFTPAARHANAFPDGKIPKPASFDDDLHDKPAWQRAAVVRGVGRKQVEANRDKPVPAAIPPAEWGARGSAYLNYFRTLLAVDESIGRVLETLQEIGRLDNTVVVFASDNGFFMGEHHQGDKRQMYEESIRIPLLVRYPRMVKAGTVNDGMVLNIDVAPTFVDLAGVEIPATMQGRSLRPLLAGEEVPWRNEFLYEYFREAAFPGIPTMVGIRTRRHSYVRYPEIQDSDELYDLEADPHQMRNLAQDPKHAETLAGLRRDLERLMKETGYRKPMPKQAQRANAFVLVFDFSKDEGDRVVDSSGSGNHGTATGAPIAEGRNSRKARRFDSKGRIEVPKSATLDCSRGPWTVEAVVRSDQPDGVVLARGGQSLGYALYLEDGRPMFTVRTEGEPVTVAGKESIVGKWTHLAAVIGQDLRVALYVNGRSVGSEKLPGFLARDPFEAMQIGADMGSQVVAYKRRGGFAGLIESVRIFSGDHTAEEIERDAAKVPANRSF